MTISMQAHLQRLFRFVAWANRRTLEAVQATPAAQSEALPLLAHIYAAEHTWLSRLLQRDPQHAVWPTLSLAACEQLAAENEAGYRAFWENLSDDQLSEVKQYRNAAGQEFATSVLDILLQVITHGGYHRGQIAKIIGRAGGTAINTDFIMFARAGN